MVARDEAAGGDSLVSEVRRAMGVVQVEANVEVKVDEDEDTLREDQGGTGCAASLKRRKRPGREVPRLEHKCTNVVIEHMRV